MLHLLCLMVLGEDCEVWCRQGCEPFRGCEQVLVKNDGVCTDMDRGWRFDLGALHILC